MRTFISIELPREAINELVEIQKKIEKLGLVKAKYTEEKNIHLTLKFLGEITEDKLEIIKEKLKDFKFGDFEVEFGELGVFSEKLIRIVWISLKSGNLFELQREIDEVLEGEFEKENRFMAHITIARVKYVEDKKKFIESLKKIEFGKLKFKVSKVFLKESKLNSKGPEYFDLLVAGNV